MRGLRHTFYALNVFPALVLTIIVCFTAVCVHGLQALGFALLCGGKAAALHVGVQR